MRRATFFTAKVDGIEVRFFGSQSTLRDFDAPWVAIEDINRAIGWSPAEFEKALIDAGMVPADRSVPGDDSLQIAPTVSVELALNFIATAVAAGHLPLPLAERCVDAITAATKHWLAMLEIASHGG